MAVNNRKNYNKYYNKCYNNFLSKKYNNIVFKTLNHSQIVKYYVHILTKLENIIINDIINNKKINVNIFVNYIKCLQLSNPTPSENKNIINIMIKYLKSLNKDEFNDFKTLYNNITNSQIYISFQNYFKSYIEENRKNELIKRNNIIKKNNIIKNTNIIKKNNIIKKK